MRATCLFLATAACALAGIPLVFEPNVGQGPNGADAIAHTAEYALILDGTEATFSAGGDARPLRLRLANANKNATVELLDPLPGVSHYFRGSDPAGWRRNVKQYRKARVRDVYPGVSMTFYGRDGRLEYDFEVEPGANPDAIEMEFDAEIALDANGDVVVPSARGTARLHAPLVYQGKRPVRGEHRLSGRNRVRFTLGEYDPGRPLVIDPVLSWSASLTGGRPTINDIVVDREGNSYLTGCAASGLQLVNAYLEELTPDRDAIILKLNPAGDTLLYSTYIGGGCGSYLALDKNGDVVFAGVTNNRYYPLRNPASTRQSGGFLTRLSADGSELVYSTFLGGDTTDTVNNFALDVDGNAVVTGRTRATAFRSTATLTIASPDATQPQVRTGFVAKYSPSGVMLWAARLGAGINPSAMTLLDGRTPVIGGAICGERYPVNDTGSSDLPEGCDAFVVATDGRALTGLYRFGGSGWDGISQMTTDRANRVYLGGVTFSADLPGAKGSLKGKWDTYVAKLAPGLDAMEYVSYLGGTGEEGVSAVAVDASGRLTVAGTTTSRDFPMIDALRVQRMGAREPMHVSDDGGRTWTGVQSNGEQKGNWYTWRGTVTALAATSNPNIVYSADRFGLYRSEDAGLTWGLVFSRPEGWQIRSLHPFPGNPESLYLVATPAAPLAGVATPANTVWTIWQSTNGGRAFTSRATFTLPAADRFGFWFSAKDPNLMYALHRRRTDPQLFRSENGGRNWERAGVLPNLFLSLAVDQTTMRMYTGTDLGIYVSDDGETWRMHSPCPTDRYLACGYQEIYIDPADSKRMFFTRRGGREYGAVNQHLQVFASADGGETWTSSQTPIIGDASGIAADPANPGVYYLGFTGTNGLYRTTDAGKTWTPAAHTAPFWTDTVNALAVVGNSRVLVGTNSGNDAYFATLSEDGSAWIQSSLLGGTGNDSVGGLRADDNGWYVVLNNAVQRIDKGNGACELTTQPAEYNAHFQGVMTRVNIRTGSECEWKIDNPTPWLMVTTSQSGSGSAAFELLVAPNTGGSPRTGTLTVNGQTLTVTQVAAPACTVTTDLYRLLSPNRNRDAVTVNYSGGCQWNTAKDANWVALDQPVHGGTTSFIPYTVEPNTGNTARQALLTFTTSGGVSTGVHAVMQSAPNCKVSVTAAPERIPATGGQATISLKSEPANCAAWVADSGVAWATPAAAPLAVPGAPWPIPQAGAAAIPPAVNFGVKDGSVTFNVQPNNDPLERAMRLQMGGVGIRIVQDAVKCTVTMKPATQAIDAATLQALVTVNSPTGCTWTAVSDSPWLRITSTTPTRGTAFAAAGPSGNGRVYFTVDANNTGRERTATIKVAEGTFTLVQAP